MIGFPGQFADGFMLGGRDHPFVDHILIGVKRGVLTVHFRNLRPQAPGTPDDCDHRCRTQSLGVSVVSIAIHIHCLLAFFCTKLLISSASTSRRCISTLGLQVNRLDVEMIRQRLKTLDDETQEPLEPLWCAIISSLRDSWIHGLKLRVTIAASR